MMSKINQIAKYYNKPSRREYRYNIYNSSKISAPAHQTEMKHIIRNFLQNSTIEKRVSSKNRVRTIGKRVQVEVVQGDVQLLLSTSDDDNRPSSDDVFYYKTLIEKSESVNDVIDILKRTGLDAIVNHLTYLKKLTDKETDEKPMDVKSLQNAARFIIENRQWTSPQIVISAEGLTYLRWKIGEKGVLAMVFLPSALVRFTAILHNLDDGSSERCSGTMRPRDILRAVKPFVDKISKS